MYKGVNIHASGHYVLADNPQAVAEHIERYAGTSLYIKDKICGRVEQRRRRMA